MMNQLETFRFSEVMEPSFFYIYTGIMIMVRTILFYFLFLLFMSGCNGPAEKTAVPQKEGIVVNNDSIAKVEQQEQELTYAYERGIAAYITAMKEKKGGNFDTLFLGKDAGFPAIKLPSRIENTGILVLTNEEADKKLQYHKTFVFVNMIGTITSDEQDFLMVTFNVDNENDLPHYRPQHNCHISFTSNDKGKTFDRDTLWFEYCYATK